MPSSSCDAGSNGYYLSITSGAYGEWWMVDLGQSFWVASVTIFGRSATYAVQSSALTIYVGDSPLFGGTANAVCASGVNAAYGTGTNVACSMVGRYVTVRIMSSNPLSLCQVSKAPRRRLRSDRPPRWTPLFHRRRSSHRMFPPTGDWRASDCLLPHKHRFKCGLRLLPRRLRRAFRPLPAYSPTQHALAQRRRAPLTATPTAPGSRAGPLTASPRTVRPAPARRLSLRRPR